MLSFQRKRRGLFHNLLPLILLLGLQSLLAEGVVAQCAFVDSRHDALFFTFERMTKTDQKEENQAVLLRLHNNTTCPVFVKSGSADNFFKPLPPNATVFQKLKREIDYDLPDGAFVPDIQYKFIKSGELISASVGDNLFLFKLLGKNSLLFEVSLSHFGNSSSDKIALPFEYFWEVSSRTGDRYSSVENLVYFWNGQLPEAVKTTININSSRFLEKKKLSKKKF
jgi:hypothetical protein